MAAADRLGFIGLGMMGLPMAANAARRGHALLACDAAPQRIAMLREAAGADAAVEATADPAAVAAACRTIVLMLPTSKQVASVIEVMRPALTAGTLIIDMGSSLPAETRRLSAELGAAGIGFIDAPVSGGVPKAKNGTLAILVGGPPALVDRAWPVLETMGESIIRTGAAGSGHAMKALNNFVYAAGLLASVEALRVGEAAGLDLSILTDVLNASSGRNVATETKLRQFVLNGAYNGGFKLGLMAKDIETAAALADEVGVAGASLATCRDTWRRALAELGGDVDNTEIHKTVRVQAGGGLGKAAE
ncbi:MAG: NAD(P)-dependent oxidoreductase [Proteobacteria bacterium]|nr:NAD(P)-dependent oxidoreductase [Pseudomonadota bacterium]